MTTGFFFCFFPFSSSNHWWKIYSKIVNCMIFQHLNKSICYLLIEPQCNVQCFSTKYKKRIGKLHSNVFENCGEGKKNANLFYKDKKMQTKVIEIIYRFFVASSSFNGCYIGSYSFFYKNILSTLLRCFMKISEQ